METNYESEKTAKFTIVLRNEEIINLKLDLFVLKNHCKKTLRSTTQGILDVLEKHQEKY